ncbi:MAG TPA: hypothetical protein VFE37_25045 [Chloroflexota bacterium]|nr:hypothetical protein [Chloroflexota bacterium]
MIRSYCRLAAAAIGVAALLGAASAAPGAAAAATIPGAAAPAPHQYVGYGYYGFPPPYPVLPWTAVNYPGSGAAAWLGYSFPYSTAGYPYGGYALPYVAYAYPYAAYAYGGAAGSPYVGSPAYPYTAWDGAYGTASGPTTASPSGPTVYWDATGYYVLP